MVVEEFEKLIATKYKVDAKNVIAVNSGTSALIAALYSLDLNGGEVITTPFTFQATSDAIILAGGKPVFADIDPETHLIDIKSILSMITDKTKAIVPVHLFGRVFDTKKLMHSMPRFIPLVEDACQCFLHPKLKLNGSLMCFSFYRTKNLQCDEGGAIIVKYSTDIQKIKAICNNGRTKRFQHEYVGFNFKMSEHCALVAYNQLKYHEKSIINELGSYDEKNGFYPKLVYHQPSYVNRGITGNCPVAEKVVKEICSQFVDAREVGRR